MVRPEQIRFLAKPNAEAPRARVLAVTFYGHDASVLLDLEAGAEKIMSRVPGHRAPRSGDDVWPQRRGRRHGLSASPTRTLAARAVRLDARAISASPIERCGARNKEHLP